MAEPLTPEQTPAKKSLLLDPVSKPSPVWPVLDERERRRIEIVAYEVAEIIPIQRRVA